MNHIQLGDIVNVYFDSVPWEVRVKVIYKPIATGDSWCVEREDGTMVAIMEFSKMEQVK